MPEHTSGARHTFVARHTVFVLSCAALLGACSEATSDADCTSSCPPAPPLGCESALAVLDQPARCISDVRCDEVQQRPDREARWTLFVHTYRKDENGDDVLLESSEVEHEKSCLAGYLASLGLTADVSVDNEWLVVESSFGQIGSVLQFTAVQSYQLECSASECALCEGLTEQACRADPFCWSRDAARLNVERSCSDRRFAGCMRSDIGCSDAITMATGADGACWQFSSSCVPDGFGAAGEGCDYAALEAVPACGPP